jgi:hypothetical protein
MQYTRQKKQKKTFTRQMAPRIRFEGIGFNTQDRRFSTQSIASRDYDYYDVYVSKVGEDACQRILIRSHPIRNAESAINRVDANGIWRGKKWCRNSFHVIGDIRSVWTAKRPASIGNYADDKDDDNDATDNYETVDENVRSHGKRIFCSLASPYLMPYLYNKRFLEKQYGFRRDGDTFMIGDSAVTVDSKGDTIINDKTFSGTKELWELLTRKIVDEI